jgi:hypothetical protein
MQAPGSVRKAWSVRVPSNGHVRRRSVRSKGVAGEGELRGRMEFLAALQETSLSHYIQESDWGHPILLCFHAIGMALVVGVILMMDLRILGYAKSMPLSIFERLLGLAWAGFAMNAVSGLLIFCSNATRLITNWTFDLKLILIVAGGLSVWWLWRSIRSRTAAGEDFDSVTPTERAIAIASAIFWICAIVSGRLIAYTLSASLAG